MDTGIIIQKPPRISRNDTLLNGIGVEDKICLNLNVLGIKNQKQNVTVAKIELLQLCK